MTYQFVRDDKELVIQTAEPPRRMDNVIYNRSYFAVLDHMGQGRCVHQTPEGYLNVIIPADRFLYVRDDETGRYFAVSFAPVYEPYESYRCTAGLNYTIIENTTHGLKATWRMYVPAGCDPVEVWDLRIQDTTGRDRQVSVFTYAEMLLEGMDLYGNTNFRYGYYDEQADALFVRQDAERHSEIRFPNHNGFLAASRRPDGWEASKEHFIGPRRALKDPQAVVAGRCGNRHASKRPPTASMHFRLSVPAGGAADLRMVVGACDHQEMIVAMRGKYLRGNLDGDEHFEALADERDAMLHNVQVDVDEPFLKPMLNIWVKQQIHHGATWVRGGYRGFRDIVQQSQGVLTQDAELARRNLLEACAHQYQDGFALRGWHPLRLLRYADCAQWLVSAVTEYIKETGDFDILEQIAPYYDKGQGSVYEHLMRAMTRLHEDRGQQGLCLPFYGDWNDSLTGVCRRGKGQSIWLSMAFCRSALLMKELAERLGKGPDAATMAAWHAEMAAAIDAHGWDGQWYLCALDDDGRPIGSHENEQGRIFLNMQSWAQLAGLADQARIEQAFQSVYRHLDSGWGLMLQWPTYTQPVLSVGRLSYMRPGIAENGSVYVHGNAFMMLALLERGKADLALKLWRDIIPANSTRPVPCQPNVFPNGYYGPDNDIAPGLAEHTWITGSAAWLFLCVTEYMLGLRRTYDGLIVRPCMPSQWKKASIRRTYRGTTYHVRIENPAGVENAPIAHLSVDGLSASADRPLPVDGRQHQVIVNLDG